jgi:hypothetical protein
MLSLPRLLSAGLRGAFAATKQSLYERGDCFAVARNDMYARVNGLPVPPAPTLFVGGSFGAAAASPFRGLYPTGGTCPSHRWS